jgi:hypothetical protein
MESSNEFMDMILSNNSPEEMSDKIKELLYNKSLEMVDNMKPNISKSMFSVVQGE